MAFSIWVLAGHFCCTLNGYKPIMLDHKVTSNEPLEFFFRADLFTLSVILDHFEKVLLLGDVLRSLPGPSQRRQC